jgi:phosphate transport system permease protein
LFRLRSDEVLLNVLRLLSLVAALVTAFIFIFILKESIPVLTHAGIFGFFNHTTWAPQEGFYNLVPMIVGSLLAAFFAVLLAAPLGILIAIFCRFYAPAGLAGIARKIVQLLAGIPSVVYGFWGLTILVPLIADFQPPGASLLAGILVLTIMILPTMALAADASFANISSHYLLSASALGLSRFKTIFFIIIPISKRVLFSGLILQTGRALGETMAILMVAGNVVQWPESIFSPIRTLSANMALEMAYARGDHRSALYFSGAILIIFVSILVSISRLFGKDVVHAKG